MEYSIVQSDLLDSEIKPHELLAQYLSLLDKDIKELLDTKRFVDYACPTTKEPAVKHSFAKMGMNYCVSQTYGNIYISPRPAQKDLVGFHQKSRAREYWLKEIWSKTGKVRKQKVNRPQMEWADTFIQQYLGDKYLCAAEYYPNQWGFLEEFKQLNPQWKYFLVNPMFDVSLMDEEYANAVVDASGIREKFDAIYLFDALDRSEDPAATMHWVDKNLKSGGLCFITCLLSSGLEAQVLGERSGIFMPPERLNLFSYEGLIALLDKYRDFQILEFSTPGVLDIPNIMLEMENSNVEIPSFIRYILKTRNDPTTLLAFQDFLQMNKLSSFGRLVLKKD